MAERTERKGLGSKSDDYDLKRPEIGMTVEDFFGKLQIARFFSRWNKTRKIQEAKLKGKPIPTFRSNKFEGI